MNGKMLSTALIILVVAVAVVGGALAYRTLFSSNVKPTESICQSCFENVPVGDIIIPQLSIGASGKSNAILNMSLGERLNLTVEVFLSINASVNVSFETRLTPSSTSFSGSAFSVDFYPSSFEALENKNATTVMTISSSNSAPKGLYSTEVVVTDLQDSNYTWGMQIEIQLE
jgi:hypothetical protein